MNYSIRPVLFFFMIIGLRIMNLKVSEYTEKLLKTTFLWITVLQVD